MLFDIDYVSYTDMKCQNFCVCDGDGICYKKPNDFKSSEEIQIDIFPLCYNGSCHINGLLRKGRLQSSDNIILSTMTDLSVKNATSNLLKISSISCNSCEIKNSTCQGDTVLSSPEKVVSL